MAVRQQCNIGRGIVDVMNRRKRLLSVRSSSVLPRSADAALDHGVSAMGTVRSLIDALQSAPTDHPLILVAIQTVKPYRCYKSKTVYHGEAGPLPTPEEALLLMTALHSFAVRTCKDAVLPLQALHHAEAAANVSAIPISGYIPSLKPK